MKEFQFFASTPKAMETLLAKELTDLGVMDVKQVVAGVSFSGPLHIAYKACLWSRLANRVLLQIAEFPVHSQEDLYDGVKQTNWFEHVKPDGSLRISFTGKSREIRNTHFGVLKVKDAIVDQMRSKFHKRPDIVQQNPDIHVHVHLQNNIAQLSLDLSGESLHRRGYREVSIKAPMKENLAAAMLILGGWPEIAQKQGSLLDPMCGSGTLLVEAAMIAADYAPGLERDYFGFMGWKQHQPELWQQEWDEARERKYQGLKQMPVIVGFDESRRTASTAIKHVENAGLSEFIHIEKRDISLAEAAASWPAGLLVCNPPYGERLNDKDETAQLYHQFGEVLKQRFGGWQAAIIISDAELGFRLGIRSQKPVTLYNGALECKLLRMQIEEQDFFIPKAKTADERTAFIQTQSRQADAEMFANRLRKNRKKLARWLTREDIHCYRLYDADLPEYAAAVDVYQGEQTWVTVQEYEAPATVSTEKANERLAGMLAELPEIVNTSAENIFLKIRKKQKQRDQYEKLASEGDFYQIEEGGCRFLVNFTDYLDTGIFLDHRPVRLRIQQQASGKRFLNLFAYTGTATVHAAQGGAASSVTIDMSNTYLQWAKDNFELNNMGTSHQIQRANCVEWLQEQSALDCPPEFDLIFMDPPTFSNSKKMDGVFDIQKNHVFLIQMAMALLSEQGELLFSTNFKRFKLDEDQLSEFNIRNISKETIAEDFARNPRIHYCWSISK